MHFGTSACREMHFGIHFLPGMFDFLAAPGHNAQKHAPTGGLSRAQLAHDRRHMMPSTRRSAWTVPDESVSSSRLEDLVTPQELG
jgi:hypothetical protein